MGEHGAIGRAPDGAAGLQHRGMEPSPVLVGAFQVKIGDPIRAAILAVAQDESMGGAAVEPHIENVKDLIPRLGVIAIAQEARLGTGLIPRIGPFGLEGVKNTGVHLWIAQQEIGVGGCRPLFREAGQRNAPCALARKHPIGPRLDHGIEPVAPGLGRPLHQLVDGGQRALPDRLPILIHPIAQGLVDGGEPLRTVQADHRRFRPPRMCIRDGDTPTP